MKSLHRNILMPTMLMASISLAMHGEAVAATNFESTASAIGTEGQWWNNYQVVITNSSSQAVELAGAVISFDSAVALGAPSWSADGVSYPKMTFTSSASGDVFTNSLSLAFDQGSWIKSELAAGASITLGFGVSGVINVDLVNSTLAVNGDSDTVVEPDPSAPIVALTAPLAGSNFTVGDVVTLSANASDVDDDLARVEFYVGSDKVAQATAAPYSALWNATLVGNYLVTAKAIDNTELETTSSAVTITVSEIPDVVEPTPPELTLTSPVNGQTVFVGSVTTLAVNAIDVNDDVSQVEFFVDGASVGITTQAPYSVTWTANTMGDYLITALASDAEGLLSNSVSATVSAKEAGSGNLTCDVKQVYRVDGSECMGDDHPHRIIGYFTSWRTGKNGLPSYLVKDLPWDKLTHINYAFASVNEETFKVQVDSSATDMTWEGIAGAEMDPSLPYKGHFNLLSKYKKQYPDVKTLISIGGWAETRGFYPMTTDMGTCGVNNTGIEAFNTSAVEFIRQYDFDGVDIDYEYPSSMKDSGNPNDWDVSNKCRGQLWDNYVVMMKDLRAKLDKAGEEDKRKYMLTIAAPASGYLLRGMADFALQDVLDYVNIMSYDLHGAWNQYVGPQSALFDNGEDAELAAGGVYSGAQYQGIGYLNTAWAYHYFRGAFAPSQINLGVPYYTRGWQGVTGGTNGLWGSASLPSQSECLEGTGISSPCGWGATGIDNLWHDKDASGNEIPAGSMPMWHAMNLANAKQLGIEQMPSYGVTWDLDPNNNDHVLQGEYQRFWNDDMKAAWLWNAAKKVFLSIEDADSLQPKLDYIVDNGIGGMMVWEMAGDYALDPQTGEYYFGNTMTNLAYDTFRNVDGMNIKHNTLAAPDSVIDVAVSTTEWPEGDNNYPINPKLVFSNNSGTDIPAGSTIEFLMATSTGDQVKDWNGAGLTVVESGHTGSNFSAIGEKKDFHKVQLTLRATESIPVGGEYSLDMVYYLPVSGVASGVRFLVGDEVIGLKSEFPSLPEFAGASTIATDNGTTTGTASNGCLDLAIDPNASVLYPSFPSGTFASAGQTIRHQNTVWKANWWTNSEPSASDASWSKLCSY